MLCLQNSDDSGQATVKIRTLSGNQSSISSVARRLRARSTASSSTTEGDDFSGLPEAAVDSEDEDEEESCPSHDSYQELKDNVRECLEKEPSERNSDDISILMVSVFYANIVFHGKISLLGFHATNACSGLFTTKYKTAVVFENGFRCCL